MEIAETLTLVQRWDWDNLSDQAHDIVSEIYEDYQNGVAQQRWTLIYTHRLGKILRDYALKGYVRDEIGVIEIAQQIIDNVARLFVNTIMCGHTAISPIDYLREYIRSDIDIDVEDFNAFTDEYFWDANQGCFRISDYGLVMLADICCEMTQCVSAEQLLALISAALNVYHQRSDLSAWLVEGGQEELCRLSNLDLAM